MGDTIEDPRWQPLLKAWAALNGLTWLVGPFLASQTLRWPAIWLYMSVIATGALVQRLHVARRNPAILARRRNVGLGTKRWDVIWAVIAAPLPALPPIVAGLAVRAGVPSLPLWCGLLGVLANTLGGTLWAHAMASNPFFEPTVRIQHELDHRVVDQGPYAIVRHPGYTAFCLGSLGAPLMLMAWPALLAAPPLALWFVLRTALEDRTLQRELPGYRAYAQRVRYRLVPGLW